MDAVGDHQRLVAHPTRFADPFDLCVQPQIRVGTGQRPLPEHGDLLVQPAAEPADGVLAHPLQAELLDQPVDLAGRDPVDVGLLDDRDQGLLGPPARLQERREIATLPQFRDGQLQLPNPGIPAPLAVAVSLAPAAVRGALTQLSAGQCGRFGIHQLLDQPRDTVAQDVGVLISHELVDQVSSGHPVALGHRGVSFVDPWTDRRS